MRIVERLSHFERVTIGSSLRSGQRVGNPAALENAENASTNAYFVAPAAFV